MKMCLIIWLTVCSMLVLSSCTVGYVSSVPVYTEGVRPPQPSSSHIWVDGNWVWSRSSNSYYRNNGYWSAPYRNRNYQQGHWRHNNRGHYWRNGHWRQPIFEKLLK